MKSTFNSIGVIGTGVIGSGWIIRFLFNKKKVYVYDPNKKQKEFLLSEIRRVLRVDGQAVINFPIHLHGHRDFVLGDFNEEEQVKLNDISKKIISSLSMLIEKKLDLFSSNVNN